MPSIDELLDEHARRWREHVDAQARPQPGTTTAAPTRVAPPRRRPVLIGVAVLGVCGGLAVAAGLVWGGGSPATHRQAIVDVSPPPGNGQSSANPTPRTRSATHAPSVAPSPTPAAWGSCGNIRNGADARSLVTSGAATALIEAHLAGRLVTSYRVLAGHVFHLRTLNLPAPPGRYIVLLGGPSPAYYAASGYYGVYHVLGTHAYQMCAYGGPQVKRGGVTQADRIIDLLRTALRH